MPQTVHVLPVNDLIEHEEEGTVCPCGPTVEPVFDDDGACGWLISHQSLDRREDRERVECVLCGGQMYQSERGWECAGRCAEVDKQ
jgi:hypothetical protein